MAVPGWPLPAFWTASAASNRAVSTARTSTSVHPATAAIGAASDASRFRFVLAWSTSEEFRLVTDGAYPQKDRGLCRVLSGARAPNDARLLLLHGRPVSMGFASGPQVWTGRETHRDGAPMEQQKSSVVGCSRTAENSTQAPVFLGIGSIRDQPEHF